MSIDVRFQDWLKTFLSQVDPSSSVPQTPLPPRKVRVSPERRISTQLTLNQLQSTPAPPKKDPLPVELLASSSYGRFQKRVNIAKSLVT